MSFSRRRARRIRGFALSGVRPDPLSLEPGSAGRAAAGAVKNIHKHRRWGGGAEDC